MQFLKKFIIIFLLISTQVFSQSKFGIDIPLYLTKSLVSVPGVFTSIEGTGGTSTDFGIGMYINISESFKVKGGFHFWKKVFNPTHSGHYTLNGQEIDGEIRENGIINYSGLYILATYEKEYIFIGGGFDISFSNSYEADIEAYDASNDLIAESKGSDKSFLTNRFNNQIDLLLNFGFKIKMNKRITLRPAIQFTLPFAKLFDTNVSVYNPVYNTTGEAAFNIFLLKYGLSAEISL